MGFACVQHCFKLGHGVVPSIGRYAFTAWIFTQSSRESARYALLEAVSSCERWQRVARPVARDLLRDRRLARQTGNQDLDRLQGELG